MTQDDDDTTKSTPKPLSNETLEHHAKFEPLPNVTAGILHVGVGNFHRSHLATYLDELLSNNPDQRDWGIVGAGIMQFDQVKRATLEKQDWLQTVVERDATTESVRVVRSMVDFVPVQPPTISQDDEDEAHAPLQQALLDPAIRIVSMTVTEGGYHCHDGKFDPSDKRIQRDASNADKPAHTLFGVLVQALQQRRRLNIQPFTIMSCDNVPHNGDIAKSVVVGLAKLMVANCSSDDGVLDADLPDWIAHQVSFPNSMVDRITIATSDAERRHLASNHDLEDQWPVFCEPFRQWILQDDFCNGRPALERLPASAGITFVEDVTPYEAMKIRVLNGGHAALCYPAALLGVKTVACAMDHAVIRPFLQALELAELVPSVPPVPNTCVKDYWKLIAERFSNPNIGDAIGRICYDGASRQPKFIVAPAIDNLKAGRTVDGLALVSALWCRYCQLAATEAGVPILDASNDPNWTRLHATAKQAVEDDSPAAWLGMSDVYGSVANNETFVNSFSSALRTVCKDGAEAAMKQYIAAVENSNNNTA